MALKVLKDRKERMEREMELARLEYPLLCKKIRQLEDELKNGQKKESRA